MERSCESVPFSVGNEPRRAVSLWLRHGFTAAAVCWFGLIVGAPFLASRPHASTPESLLILAVYGIGSLVCHQLPERSYHLWTAQLPVCARCTGIYLGAVVGILGWTCAGVFDRSQGTGGAEAQSPSVNASTIRFGPARSRGLLRVGLLRPARVLLGVAAAPTALTLAYEWSTGNMPSNGIRAAAGIPIGLVVAWLVVAAADNQVN
jgi:predicted membrane protein DUF2085